jgi:hypothetical protein
MCDTSEPASKFRRGPVAQLVEQLPFKQLVVRSSRTGLTKVALQPNYKFRVLSFESSLNSILEN